MFISSKETYQFYLDNAGLFDLLTEEEEKELAILKDSGDAYAREKLINHNLKLVIKLATSYNTTIDVLDLIQEGNRGLIHAVDKFDHNANCRLSTYATPWIRKYQLALIEKSSKQSNFTLYDYDEDGNKVERKERIISLDSLVGDDNETSLINMIPDTRDYNKELYDEELEEDCYKAINNSLEDVEKEILFSKLGIYGYDKLSTRELSENLNIKPSEVEKIFRNAKSKLANSTYLQQSFLDYSHYVQ